MSLMTAQIFLETKWPKVKADILDGLKPLKASLGTVSPSQFFDFLCESEELSQEYDKLYELQRKMIIDEMIAATHELVSNSSVKFVMAKVRCLEITLRSMEFIKPGDSGLEAFFQEIEIPQPTE